MQAEALAAKLAIQRTIATTSFIKETATRDQQIAQILENGARSVAVNSSRGSNLNTFA